MRDTVASVIDRTLAAGEDVHCAPDVLAEGDQAFTLGEYKRAFDKYRRAYHEAARAGAAGCSAAAAPEMREP